MSALSPVSDTAEPSGSVSPPSYAATPVPLPAKKNDTSDEKIAYERPIAEEGIELAPKPDEGHDLPEVVPEGHIYNSNNTNEKPTQAQHQPFNESKTAMRSADEVQNVIPPEQVQTPPPPGYNGHQMMAMTPPVNQPTGNFIPPDDGHTVTPLHLLGDQSDTIDCPFCRRRTTTEVKKTASWLTHLVAVCLFFLTFCGVLAPYMLHWSSNISHWCRNCNRKVAYRNFGSNSVVALGTPDHLREVSKFQPAQVPVPVMNPNAAQQV